MIWWRFVLLLVLVLATLVGTELYRMGLFHRRRPDTPCRDRNKSDT